jgi:hypothetical protein
MRTFSTGRIDELALVWLVLPRKESRVSGFLPQLKHVVSALDQRRNLAEQSFARLRDNGLVQPGKLLKLTEEGRRRALEILGFPKIPQSKKMLQWAKKVLLLRSIGVEPTPVALKVAGEADVLAARILARRHRLDRKIEASLSKVVAVLAWRALGLEERPLFKLDDAFSAVFLGDASASSENENGSRESSVPASAAVALRLSDCKLPDFANLVADAARSSRTGRWHGAVFISHVWDALRARGDVGITFENFQRRLVEAYQADLIELSRADLVEAMPAADVSASETTHFGARFHFIRLEQLAS